MQRFPPLLLICVLVSNAPAAEHRPAGTVEIEEKIFRDASGEKIPYQLGTFYVLENRLQSKSRVISIGFARFPCAAKKTSSPPVFRLPGGPGSSLVMRLRHSRERRIRRVLPSLPDLRKFCDVVYVDQRGFSEQGEILRAEQPAGRQFSNRPRTLDDRVLDYQRFAKDVVKSYKGSETDLRGYTVKACAADVDELRQALGYEQVILQGTSFGSQWSFAVMRQYPQTVARALLSGVEPLDHSYDKPGHVFAAVQRMWRAVDADDRFAPYLPEGGMAVAAKEVIQRLEREPIELVDDGDDKRSVVGMLGPVQFPWHDPAQILELYHGQTQRWQRAAVAGRLHGGSRRIALIGPLIDTSLGITPERRSSLWNDPANRYLSRRNFAHYLGTAPIWPSADVTDSFRRPQQTSIPVVFAQGDWDVKTPLENALEIAPYFPHSRVLIAHRGGHGVLEPISFEQPEVWQQLMEFVRTGDMAEIPASTTLRPSENFSPPKFTPKRD